MKYFIGIVAAIPLIVLAVFGFEDKNADFFKNGDGIAAEYRIVYNDQVYHLGEMVSHYANIVIVTICFEMIAIIIYTGVKKS